MLPGPTFPPYLLAVLDHTFFRHKCITEKVSFFTDLVIVKNLWLFVKEKRLALNLSSVFPLEFFSEKVLLERRQFMQGWGGEGLGVGAVRIGPLYFFLVFIIVPSLCLSVVCF